jgi:ribosome-associated translation inhibitor RaiA
MTTRRLAPKPRKKVAGKTDRRAAPSRGSATPKQARGRTGPTETPFLLRALALRVSPQLRGYVRKRVGFKLGRYGLSLSRIVVRLERPSGPTGAPAFTSRFSLAVVGMGRVVVDATRPDLREAFDASIDAAERAVRRLLERRQGRQRKVPKQRRG